MARAFLKILLLMEAEREDKYYCESDIPKPPLVMENPFTNQDMPQNPTNECFTASTNTKKYKNLEEKKRARKERRKIAKKAKIRAMENTNAIDPQHLVKRQETFPVGPFLCPPAKHQNQAQSVSDDGPRNSAKKRSELAVAVFRGDGALVDETLSSVIRARLLASMEKALYGAEDCKKLAFATSGLVSEGFFLVTPETVEARDWLLSCNLGDYEGVPIMLRRLDQPKVMVWIPGNLSQMPGDIVRWLKLQNRDRAELRPDEWTFVSMKPMPTGVRLVMGVSPEAGRVWNATQMLHFQLTKVAAKLMHGNSKPPAKKKSNNTTLHRNITCAGSTNPIETYTKEPYTSSSEQSQQFLQPNSRSPSPMCESQTDDYLDEVEWSDWSSSSSQIISAPSHEAHKSSSVAFQSEKWTTSSTALKMYGTALSPSPHRFTETWQYSSGDSRRYTDHEEVSNMAPTKGPFSHKDVWQPMPTFAPSTVPSTSLSDNRPYSDRESSVRGSMNYSARRGSQRGRSYYHPYQRH